MAVQVLCCFGIYFELNGSDVMPDQMFIYLWGFYRAKKVVLQGTNVAHLLELQALAMSLSLPTYLVQDAGVTQVRPAGWGHTCTYFT